MLSHLIFPINVDLGNYYRTLKDIQIRKGGSKTHFLDELKYKLSEKLDEELTTGREWDGCYILRILS